MKIKFYILIPALIVGYFLFSLFASTIYEVISYKRNKNAIETAAYLAYQYAIVETQETGQSNEHISESALSYYKSYLSYLTSCSNDSALGLEDSNQFKRLVAFLKTNADEYNQHTNTVLYQPSQYGLTYVDPLNFRQAFSSYFTKILAANAEGVGDVVASDCNTSYILSFTPVKLSDPSIYKSLFGVSDMSALDAAGLEDNLFDYVIQYNITITINWKHTTSSLFFQLNDSIYGALDLGSSDNFTSDRRIKIPGEQIEYNFQYILTN